MAAAEQPDPGLPIKLDPCSNGEHLPVPATAVVREAQRRARAEITRTAARLGMDRRRFLTSTCASAITLLALGACSDDERKARTGERSGGTYDLPPESTTEPGAADDVLAGDEPIMDVQGHLLEYDLGAAGADRPGAGFWRGFPQASCDADDPRTCFDIEHFMEEIFLRSDTSLVVLSAIPIVGPENPLSIDVMERTRRVALALCGDERVLLHGQANPNVGALEEQLEGMGGLVADHPITAWKVYTHVPSGQGWFLDDHDVAAPRVGEAFLRRAAELDRRIVCVHKGFSGGDRFADPVDVGPAAKAHPDLSFVVYHSGYEAGVVEGPYAGPDDPQGIDRLIASLERAGVGPGENVYAELGSTWRSVMADPDQAAHVLGKLLAAVGEDNVLWGTDSIWYGSPQDQIEAFRAFTIRPELVERHGYPELTPERKRKVLGQNAARLYGVELDAVACPFTREELRAARQAAPASFPTWGPTTAAEARALMAAHGMAV